ncbi:hypothetical protein N9485_03310 [Luminiphilus sp.]|nr:hypothetical protein [Luminiphilus sp.]
MSDREDDTTPVATGDDTTDSKLSDKESARRKLIKRAALGTGLAASAPVWVRPVVNTVVLPAHAQASGLLSPTTTTTSGPTTTTTSGPTTTTTLGEPEPEPEPEPEIVVT